VTFNTYLNYGCFSSPGSWTPTGRQFTSELDPRKVISWVLMKEKNICKLYKYTFSCDFTDQIPTEV